MSEISLPLSRTDFSPSQLFSVSESMAERLSITLCASRATSSRPSTSSARPAAAACSAVFPNLARAWTSAPRASSTLTTVGLPLNAAVCSGRSSSSFRASMSAPAAISSPYPLLGMQVLLV